ncbi:MAG: TonB-dependent receptor domain-containing protein [Gemmatimonadaceae bacterium]
MYTLRWSFRSALLAGALALLSVDVAAQVQDTTSVSGRVTDRRGAPVVGAFILIDSAKVPSAQTDADGRYAVARVARGAHALTARRTGYSPSTVTVTLDAGTAIGDIVLDPVAATLAAVTVIGSRSDLAETRLRLQQVPGAVALIDHDAITSTRQANFNDVLRMTPGVYVQSRFGAADESQISVRGSGLRSNFHARGINLLVNGMPYRNADGFTDFESLELLTTEAIEVYKGANAFRYGGSTLGGAINMQTKTGRTASPIGVFAEGGSYGFQKAQLSSGAEHGAFDYYASYARTSLGGYRDWASQHRDRFNLHAGYRITPTVDARAFYIAARVHEHLPGSVDEATLDSAPTRADPTNVANRWGREYTLHHVGLQLRTQLTATQRLEISPYMQYRDIDHPIFEVISQISHDWGAEVRYENTAPLGVLGNRLTVGYQPAYLTMQNRQYVNAGGAHGALTRDEVDRVATGALYAEDALSLSPRMTVTLGGRVDRTTRWVADRFLSNGDQSDRQRFTPVTPRFGVLWSARGGNQLFANASRTVEPPLLLELTSFGNSGGFNSLHAQDAWQYELGVRGDKAGAAWEVSLYDIELRDEIVNLNVAPFPGAAFTVPTYRNVDRSRHRGLEAGIGHELRRGMFIGATTPDRLIVHASYTLAKNSYVRDAEFSGHELPGAPRHYGTAELSYVHPSGFTLTPSIEIVPEGYYVNSENTVKNRSWSNIGVRAEWAIARTGATAFVSARNLANRVQSQSVQVDNAAGKYFEPSDARAVYAGVRWER